MISAHLTSLLLLATEPSNDKVRQALSDISDRCFFWMVTSSIVVGVGVILEAPEATIALKRWFRLWRGKDVKPENEKSLVIPIAYLGLLLVVVGVAGEVVFEFLSSNAETAIREHDSRLLGAAELEAGQAKMDAANARKETAQLQKDTQGLKTDADAAKRDMVAAQLELARLTGPVHLIHIIHGIATPDLSKGLIPQILLTEDVRIKPPILPPLSKEGTATWTLFLDQDSVGSHQYTFEFMRDVKAYPGLVPNSRASFDFVTDTHGRTTMRGIPIVDMPNTATPSKK